jgi:hypothetical protein
LILCAPQSLFGYARSKWPTRKSSIIEPSTSKANPSIAGRQNRPGNRKEHFAKRYATKMYLNDAIGRWNHFKTEAGIKSDEGSRILCWSSLYTKHQDGFNCGKHITHIPGYFSYVNVVIFPHYKTLLCTFSAVEIQTDQQPDETIQCSMSHCQYMFSKGKQLNGAI